MGQIYENLPTRIAKAEIEIMHIRRFLAETKGRLASIPTSNICSHLDTVFIKVSASPGAALYILETLAKGMETLDPPIETAIRVEEWNASIPNGKL